MDNENRNCLIAGQRVFGAPAFLKTTVIEARIRRSPDTADAPALTFAFKVHARHELKEEVDEFPGMFSGQVWRNLEELEPIQCPALNSGSRSSWVSAGFLTYG